MVKVSNSIITSNGRNHLLDKAYNPDSTNSVISVFKIGTGTTDPLVSDTSLETPITGWFASGDTKTFVSVYPSFDTTNNEVTIQGFVSSTEANGNSISEFGTFNTDGTPIMDMRATMTDISKTATDEITFTTVNRLREPE